MAFHIHITTGARSPIYRQIADQIRLAVATGTLSPDEQVPSVRAQAERLVVNPNTVARAYSELIRDGVLRSEQGRGVFVSSNSSMYTKAERRRRIQPLLDAFVQEALALRLTAVEIRGILEKKLSQLKLPQHAPGDTRHE